MQAAQSKLFLIFECKEALGGGGNQQVALEGSDPLKLWASWGWLGGWAGVRESQKGAVPGPRDARDPVVGPAQGNAELGKDKVLPSSTPGHT